MAETHGLLVSRIGRDAGFEFLTALPNSMEIVRANGEDELAALRLLRQHQDKAYSYVDALSFVIMNRLGIRRAFTFDRHFEQFGLEVLRPTT